MRTTDDGADPRWSCHRKKGYADQRLAERVAKKAGDRAGRELVAYACTHCGSWHIGRPTG